jgi:hypothetical protein
MTGSGPRGESIFEESTFDLSSCYCSRRGDFVSFLYVILDNSVSLWSSSDARSSNVRYPYALCTTLGLASFFARRLVSLWSFYVRPTNCQLDKLPLPLLYVVVLAAG